MSDTTNKPVIFLAFANDRDDTIGYLRNLPDEARRLRDVLEPAEQAGLCEVVVRSNSTAGDIFKVFQDPKYRNRIAILHYGGHANGYELLLESAAGQAAAADAGGLAKFLGQQQGLQLVFLNGCSTQQQTQGLLDANISAVISTSRAIEDQVATDFSHEFYQGLAGGASIRTAYNEAEASVQTAKGGNTRALYFGDADDPETRLEADRWPWNLYLREGSENADQWNLPEAVNDPLFGLPPLPEKDLPESPYRHLNWFTRKDAEVFFGRGHQIRELYDRLTAPRSAPIMLFYGQSGVGKSSILDAGLIPRLEQDYEVRYLRRTEGGLLDTLGLAFLPEAIDVPIETAWRVKEEQTGKPLIVFLDQVEELYTRPIADLPDELDRLLKVVQATFVQSDQRPRGKLVLGFRKEWLAELEAQLVDYELPRTKVFLEPLDRRGIVEVVQGPAQSERLRERYGLTVEGVLSEIIADDLLADRDSAIAPTLQILLTKMWTKATEANYEHPQFSQELYQQLRREGILLRDFLNQQIAAFGERYPEAVDSGLLLDIVALHTTPLGTADQRTVEHLQQQYAHLDATLPELLQRCQDLHLLTVAASAQKERTKTTRLAHDTLAPLVREQFDESDKPGQRARRILDNRSVDWEGDQTGTPLDEADLKVVEQGVPGTRALSATEQRLVEASRELRARLKRLRMILKTAGAVAVAVIAVTAGIAAIGWLKANEQKKEAEEQKKLAEEKTKEAEVARDEAKRSDYNVRFSRAMDLYRRKPNEAKKILETFPDNLRDFAWGFHFRLCNRDIKCEPYQTPVNCVRFSPDGKRLATADNEGNVRLREHDGSWRTLYNHPVETEIKNIDVARSVAFSPKGEFLASAANGQVKIWDFATEPEHDRLILKRTRHKDEKETDKECVLFTKSANGSLMLVYTADFDTHVYCWDPVTGEELPKKNLNGSGSVIVDGPEQGMLVVGCNNGTFKLLKIDTDELVATVPAHQQKIRAMSTAETPQAFHLVTASDDKEVTVWEWKVQSDAKKQIDPTSQGSRFEKIRVFKTTPREPLAVAISPDGQKIAWGSGDDIEVRFLGDGNRSLTIPKRKLNSAEGNRESPIQSLDFAADGRILASASYDSVVLWNTEDSSRTITGNEAREFPIPEAPRFDFLMEWKKLNLGEYYGPFCGAKSPNGKFLAFGALESSGRRNNVIVVASVDTGEQSFSPIQPEGNWVQKLAWSPDGRIIVSSDRTLEGSDGCGRIKLWDSTTGEPRGTLEGHNAQIELLVFDEPGLKLTSKDSSGQIREWRRCEIKPTP